MMAEEDWEMLTMLRQALERGPEKETEGGEEPGEGAGAGGEAGLAEIQGSSVLQDLLEMQECLVLAMLEGVEVAVGLISRKGDDGDCCQQILAAADLKALRPSPHLSSSPPDLA